MNCGFFKSESLPSIKTTHIVKIRKSKVRSSVASKVFDCDRCGLHDSCFAPKMSYTGEGKKSILVIGDFPSTLDEKKGNHFLGHSSKYLRSILSDLDADLDVDCWKTYAIQCAPVTKDPKKLEKEIKCCRSRVWEEITKLKPKVIILLGKIALSSVIGNMWKKNLGGISKWQGWTIPDRHTGAWICPTFHPKYVSQSDDNPAISLIFQNDIKNAVDLLDRPFPVFSDDKEKVKVILDERETIRQLSKISDNEPEVISFDYETTGLKPHKKDHSIRCCSICYSETESISFLVTDKVKPVLKEILENENIGKVAHNLKFEDMWSFTGLNATVKNWKQCTMVAAHILDNRAGICSLKFQTYINDGVVDYDSSISHFLKGSDDKDSNSFNNVYDAPVDDLLLYCGLDSLYGYLLYQKQKPLIESRYKKAYDLFHKGLLSLIQIERQGFSVDYEYCIRTQKRLLRRMEALESDIYESDEVVFWKDKYKDKFKLGSDTQLGDILFNHLKLKPTKRTAGGSPSVDRETLEKIKVPFVQDLIKLRKMRKNNSTYFGGLIRETVDSKLHSFFHLHSVTSYRSSSSNINFQNIPVRDEEVSKMIRSGIVPSPGNQLLEVDYGSLEVCVSACVHKDPRMIAYIEDKSTDMHRDMAMQIFKLNKNQISKDIRYCSKSHFVFAEFYGDWYGSCARLLWEDVESGLKINGSDMSLRDHLEDKRITSYDAFESHLAEVEDDFWNKRFKVYTEWKLNHLAEYHRNGYFNTLTGFRCSGVMKKNVALNLPIQGPAFHCLLWSLNRLTEIKAEEGWKSNFVGQIHDSMIIDLVPEEREHVLKIVKRVSCEDIRKEWDWIIVPFDIDAEITQIDEPWFYKKEISI